MSTFAHLPTSTLPRPGRSRTVVIGGFTATTLIDSATTGGSLAVVEHTLAPGLLGAPPHSHEREDEASYVLSGTLTVQVGTETTTAGPGDIVYKPREIVHAFWNAGPEPVRFLEVITPGGFEMYFGELAVLIPADGPPDLGALAALAGRYGMTFDFAAMPALMEKHGVRLGA